jgi:hypothetical protein
MIERFSVAIYKRSCWPNLCQLTMTGRHLLGRTDELGLRDRRTQLQLDNYQLMLICKVSMHERQIIHVTVSSTDSNALPNASFLSSLSLRYLSYTHPYKISLQQDKIWECYWMNRCAFSSPPCFKWNRMTSACRSHPHGIATFLVSSKPLSCPLTYSHTSITSTWSKAQAYSSQAI